MQTRRQRTLPATIEHDDADEDDEGFQDPQEFLDRNHPENDQFMQGVEHVQRQIMHQNSLLRPKQVQILKSIFAGNTPTEVAAIHHCARNTIYRLVKSPNGQRLLNLLQYHLKLIEGPNEAQQRNMAWRIAIAQETIAPKISLQAIDTLHKMRVHQEQLKNPALNGSQPTAPIIININQETLPRTQLDN